MRTAGVIAGVIATTSATIYPFMPYSNKTEVKFNTAKEKEYATEVVQQVLEGNEALVKADVSIFTQAAKADKLTWAQAWARGATTNPPLQAPLRYNMWFTKDAAAETYTTSSALSKSEVADTRDTTKTTVAVQLDKASADTFWSADKTGLTISGSKFTTGSDGNSFTFKW